jgi:hypothetical protein
VRVVAGNVFLSRLCGARVYPVPRLPVEQLNDRCEVSLGNHCIATDKTGISGQNRKLRCMCGTRM